MAITKAIIFLTCIVSALAEPPVRNTYYFAKQESAPYPASGWKPDGASFDLPAKQYGAPAASQTYGTPALATQSKIGTSSFTSAQSSTSQAGFARQYGAPAVPERQYGAPAAPERQYGAPASPQTSYGAPTPSKSTQSNRPAFGRHPETQYGTPAAPQTEYGTPEPQTQYGTPEESTQDYGTTFPTTESQAEPVNSVNELDEGNVDEQNQGEYFIALPDGRLQRVQYVSRQDLEAMKYFARIQAENVEPLRGPIYAYQPLQKLQFAPANLEVEAVPVATKVPVAAKVQVPKEVASFMNYPEQRFLINF